MTIKEVIEESKDILQKIQGETDRESAVAKLHNLLVVLAVKAENVTDTDTEELVAKIDQCRELLKQGAIDDADKVLVFVNLLCEIQSYKWEEDEWEEMERINAEDDKRFALEDIQKAYNNFIQLKNEYIKRYGESPEIKTED